MNGDSMVKHKKIPQYPTEFILDVWITKKPKELALLFHNKYGADESYYRENIRINSVYRFCSTIKSESKGRAKIAVVLMDLNRSTIVHEIQHIIDFLSAWTEIERGMNATEWNAYFASYLFREISGKGYELVA